MALTAPLPLAFGRFKRLPQRTGEVWQGGLVRLPAWIEHPTDPDGEPARPIGALWVSLRTGLIHLALPSDGSTASPELMGVPFQRMNTLVKGRRGVTADTALRLAALTGMDAGFWMGLQADYDLWHALRDVDLSKITPLKKSA